MFPLHGPFLGLWFEVMDPTLVLSQWSMTSVGSVSKSAMFSLGHDQSMRFLSGFKKA